MLTDLLSKQINRKQFLVMLGTLLLAIIGCNRLKNSLSNMAKTDTANSIYGNKR